MPSGALEKNAEQVLVLAPTGKDALVAVSILAKAAISAEVCPDLTSLCSRLDHGAGGLVVAQEALSQGAGRELIDRLAQQPPWSDVPLVLLTSGDVEALHSERAVALFGAANVTLLERPFRASTLISVVQATLRYRRRQYQVRELLSQHEQLLEAERSARSEAESANRMKDEFLASLSHELRTPLNAIVGWCQLLQMTDCDADEIKHGLEVIQRSANVQTQLIEDLLDISRIISGKLRLDVQRVSLPDVIEAALATVMPAAEAKEIRVQRIIDPLAGPVSGDPARLQQVVWNLLSNAIKFTPKQGTVQVKLERVNSHIELNITDTGEGIAADFLPYVFDRFRQADGSSTRQHGGLGLGLAIVRQLVEMHGGTARVKSPGKGKGSTFIIDLPIAALHPPKDGDRRVHPRADAGQTLNCEKTLLDGLRVLVVDDDSDSRDLLARVLRECGADVTTARSADEAIERIDDKSPQLLVSDIGMPIRDGYDLIAQVRKNGHGAAHIPAIALTAFARSEDRQRALLAGFQMHIAKPVNPSELTAAVASLAGRTGRG